MENRKENIICYLKLLAGLSLVFPFVHVFFALDFGLLKGGFIALGVLVGQMAIGIPMFNYLEYGKFSYWVKQTN